MAYLILRALTVVVFGAILVALTHNNLLVAGALALVLYVVLREGVRRLNEDDDAGSA